MDQDSVAQLVRRTEAAVAALRHLTERAGRLARDWAGEARFVATHPPAAADELRRGAEELVDLGTAWIVPVRRLSEEQRRLADQMATWAERHRQLAEEMASWAERQRSIAEYMASLSDPLLGYPEQLAEATKGLLRAALTIPGGAGAGHEEPGSGH